MIVIQDQTKKFKRYYFKLLLVIHFVHVLNSNFDWYIHALKIFFVLNDTSPNARILTVVCIENSQHGLKQMYAALCHTQRLPLVHKIYAQNTSISDSGAQYGSVTGNIVFAIR